MNTWIKKPVTRQQIAPLCTKFGLDELTASILFRRDITDASELLYFLETDLRFQHNPFSFSSMEDAGERIYRQLVYLLRSRSRCRINPNRNPLPCNTEILC